MVLELKKLSTGYENKTISQDLSLLIPQGKITALIGANGCGKSTLLKTICRINKPLGGDVLLDGKSIYQWEPRQLAKQVAILPQNPVAPNELRVRELVAYGRSPHQSAFFSRMSKEDRDIVAWALRETDIEDLADKAIGRLSGGQRQRAWIAMAIAQHTPILFLDEPTSFLDVAHQMDVLHLIRKMNQDYGKTIVMVIHDLNEAARFADYILAMKKGQILYEGHPEDVFHEAMLFDVFGIDAELLQDPRTGRPMCIPYSLRYMDKERGESTI